MRFKTIKIFRDHKGIEELSRKEFIENLDLGIYDNERIEIISTNY